MKKYIPTEFVFQLATLLIAVIVVHAFYVAVVRPNADAIIEERCLEQVSDSGAIEAVVDRIIADNPDKVAEYKGGKDKLIGLFVGQVMIASQGKANPKMANEMLNKKLNG